MQSRKDEKDLPVFIAGGTHAVLHSIALLLGFVVIKDGTKTYIQVSDDISSEETFNREVSPLLKIRDAFPKILIARTKHEKSQYQGIEIIDIARWLISQK